MHLNKVCNCIGFPPLNFIQLSPIEVHNGSIKDKSVPRILNVCTRSIDKMANNVSYIQKFTAILIRNSGEI